MGSFSKMSVFSGRLIVSGSYNYSFVLVLVFAFEMPSSLDEYV